MVLEKIAKTRTFINPLPNKKTALKIRTMPSCRGRLLELLAKHPNGMIRKQLMIALGLPSRTIYDNLRLLEQQKLIIHNRPIWQSAQVESTPIESAYLFAGDNINLHNLSFLIKLIKKPYWWGSRTNKLLKLKECHIKNIDTGRYIYQQFTKEDYAVQFHKESIIVIIRKVYHGLDAYDCLIQGITDFLAIYQYISDLFQFKFFEDGIPQAMIRSQHTAKLYDAVAKRCKKNGSIFEVWHDGQLRMYIDSSHPTGLEAIKKEYCTEDIDRYTRYVEDIICHNPPKASEMAESLTIFLQSQERYAENIHGHIDAIKGLTGQMAKFNGLLEELAKIIKYKH